MDDRGSSSTNPSPAEIRARHPAIYAAAAAGEERGGHAGMIEAIRQMGSTDRSRYRPRPEAQRSYDDIYRDYLDLARHFGEGGTEVMKRLRRLRAEAR